MAPGLRPDSRQMSCIEQLDELIRDRRDPAVLDSGS